MRRTALILLIILTPATAGARWGDRVTYTEVEYRAAWRKLQAVRPAADPARAPSCDRVIGHRENGILIQACLDAAGGSHMRCVRLQDCDTLRDKLEQFCHVRERDGIPCIYEKGPGR